MAILEQLVHVLDIKIGRLFDVPLTWKRYPQSFSGWQKVEAITLQRFFTRSKQGHENLSLRGAVFRRDAIELAFLSVSFVIVGSSVS